jgi:hypothetical protein
MAHPSRTVLLLFRLREEPTQGKTMGFPLPLKKTRRFDWRRRRVSVCPPYPGGSDVHDAVHKKAEPTVTVGLFGNFVARFSIVRAFEDGDVFLEPSYPSFDDT